MKTTIKPQGEMLKEAQSRLTKQYETLMELITGPNPITKGELRKLIQKRPEVWAKFAAYEGSLQ
jgi:hypothetical protein